MISSYWRMSMGHWLLQSTPRFMSIQVDPAYLPYGSNACKLIPPLSTRKFEPMPTHDSRDKFSTLLLPESCIICPTCQRSERKLKLLNMEPLPVLSSTVGVPREVPFLEGDRLRDDEARPRCTTYCRAFAALVTCRLLTLIPIGTDTEFQLRPWVRARDAARFLNVKVGVALAIWARFNYQHRPGDDIDLVRHLELQRIYCILIMHQRSKRRRRPLEGAFSAQKVMVVLSCTLGHNA